MGYLGNTPGDKFLTLEKQVFTTSATDTYLLDREVSSPNDLELFLNNVRQEPVEAYSCSGTTLTLASAITASDSMYCIYQGRAVGTQSPAVGSVTNAMLAGSIANSKLANSSITLNGSAVSLGGSANAGITEADTWRLNTAFVNGNTSFNDLTANLERDDTTGSGYLGTGMTQSSGVFTFPSTGIWLIRQCWYVYDDADFAWFEGFIRTTINNSSYDTRVQSGANVNGRTAGSPETTATGECFFDVTDTSTHKVRFSHQSSDPNVNIFGNTNYNATHFTFIRLGDT